MPAALMGRADPQRRLPPLARALRRGELYLPTEGLRDIAAEKSRLSKEVEKYQAEIAKVEQKLSNPAFVEKVPPQVFEEHQKRLTDWQEKLAHVRKAIEMLE